jgi:hypothetical protein
MIYGFKNRNSFFEIKLLILAHMFDIRLPESSNGRFSESRHRQNQATSGRRNTDGAEIWRHPATVAGCRRTKFWPKLVGIWQWSEAGRIWPKWRESGWI